jgi:hypothetical protein
MESEILFTEKQKFRQWWVWTILLGINGLFIFGLVKQILFKQEFGDNPMSNKGLILFMLFMLVFTFLFSQIGLETQITNEGIAIRFLLFEKNFRLIKWQEISKCYIRQYHPIREYGGWGIRFGSHGTAYNVFGNQGIQLELLDGRNILIGTNKPAEVQAILNSVAASKHP